MSLRNRLQNGFQLHAKLPRSVRVNRTLVLIVSAVLLFIVVFAMVASLSSTPHRKVQQKTVKEMRHGMTTTVSPAIESVPQNYTNVAGIKRYTPQPLAPTDTGKIPASVQQTLDNLREQQTQLQHRLASLIAQKQAETSTNDIRSRQAKDSGLFFSGAAPEAIKTGASGLMGGQKGKTASQSGAGKGATQSSYAQQNMQSAKINFLKPSKTDKTDIYDMHSLVRPLSPYEVQAGTVVSATLLTAINSSLPGETIAQVRQDVFDTVSGQYLLIPKGSKLLGKYQSRVSYGQTRVLIAFSRIIRPDGSSIELDKSTGADQMGRSGMAGNVNNHWGRVLGAAMISTLLSMGTGAASNNGSVVQQGNNFPSSGQMALYGAANNISQAGQQLTNRAINIQPTLTIPAGYTFNVIVNKDMILAPFPD